MQLVDTLKERENEMRADVIKRIENHRRWNENHVDLTSESLKPVKDWSEGAGFRPATTQYLMTPPASESSRDDEPMAMELDEPEMPHSNAVFQFKGMPSVENDTDTPTPGMQFRRRIGRLNRLWIDRKRVTPSPSPEPPSFFGEAMQVDTTQDRWKYDEDSDDEPEVYRIDPYDSLALKFRSSIPLSIAYPMRRPDVPPNGGQRPNGVAGQQVRPAILQRPPGQPGAAASNPSAAAPTVPPTAS